MRLLLFIFIKFKVEHFKIQCRINGQNVVFHSKLLTGQTLADRETGRDLYLLSAAGFAKHTQETVFSHDHDIITFTPDRHPFAAGKFTEKSG